MQYSFNQIFFTGAYNQSYVEIYILNLKSETVITD